MKAQIPQRCLQTSKIFSNWNFCFQPWWQPQSATQEKLALENSNCGSNITVVHIKTITTIIHCGMDSEHLT